MGNMLDVDNEERLFAIELTDEDIVLLMMTKMEVS
jgi:hypothetical protein